MAKFADVVDVTSRYEGAIPDGRLAWVEVRIGDVENVLMGLVPSLRKPLDDIRHDSAAAGDPGRLERVVTLVCDKVLDLYRNPDGASTKSESMEAISVSRTYSRESTRGAISFTPAELDSVKLRKRRSRIGTIGIEPWVVDSTSRRYPWPR